MVRRRALAKARETEDSVKETWSSEACKPERISYGDGIPGLGGNGVETYFANSDPRAQVLQAIHVVVHLDR